MKNLQGEQRGEKYSLEDTHVYSIEVISMEWATRSATAISTDNVDFAE